jgi:hypothetical protein
VLHNLPPCEFASAEAAFVNFNSFAKAIDFLGRSSNVFHHCLVAELCPARQCGVLDLEFKVDTASW